MSTSPIQVSVKKNWPFTYCYHKNELSSIYYNTLNSIPKRSFPIGRCPDYHDKLQRDCQRVKNIVRNLDGILRPSDFSEGLTLCDKKEEFCFPKSSKSIEALDLPRCSLAQQNVHLICDASDYDIFYAPKNNLDLKHLSVKTADVALNFYDSLGFIDAPIESLCRFLDAFGIEGSLKKAKLPPNTKLFLKEKTIREEEIASQQKIGEGTYGKVYFLEYNQRPYALKRMKNLRGGTAEQIRALFLHEMAIHQMIYSFEHIVKMEACYDSGMFLEYAPNGMLFDVIYKKLSTPQKIKAYFTCIAKGLKVIHDRGFNYKDLKSNNVLIFSDSIAKICDLGFVTPSLSDIDVNVCQDYAAPEIYFTNEENPISSRADIWSFGVLLFEALSSGRLPLFPGIRGDKKYLYFVARASRQSSPLHFDTLMYAIEPDCMDFFRELDPHFNFLSIVQKCLHFNPARRPDADRLIELFDAIKLE